MPLQFAKPPVVSRGVMTFVLANNAVLYLSGVLGTQTTPTKAMSGGKIETDPTCFLVNGIPLGPDGKHFAGVGPSGFGDVNGHAIKHAIVQIVSVAAGGTQTIGAAKDNDGDGTVPDANHGFSLGVGSIRELWNSRSPVIENYALINLSGQNMTVEVAVEE